MTLSLTIPNKTNIEFSINCSLFLINSSKHSLEGITKQKKNYFNLNIAYLPTDTIIMIPQYILYIVMSILQQNVVTYLFLNQL